METVQDNNLRYWTSPPDYPERIIDIIKQLAADTKDGGINNTYAAGVR